MPVGGVFGGWSLDQVGEGPLLIEPGQFPSGLGMVGPAWPDLVGEVVGVLHTQHGFHPVEELGEFLVALLVVHREPEPRGWGVVVLISQEAEDLLDLAPEFRDVAQHSRVSLLRAGDRAYLDRQRFDVAA